MFTPNLGEKEWSAVQRPVARGWLTMGEEVFSLEERIKKEIGAKHVFLVTNCTAALHLAAVALKLGPGEEVLCPTLTFVASANAIRAVGADVVFCESSNEDDLTVDADDIVKRISPRTRAIVCVHYAGFPCRMSEIKKISEKHDLKIIEDCAHAVFTKNNNRVLGTVGDVGCFSFFSNKNITCGEGGAIATNNDELAEKIRLLRSHGMTTLTLDRHMGRAHNYDVAISGFNYRMDEMRAALLDAQLDRLKDLLDRRRKLYVLYREFLDGTRIHLPFSNYPEQPDWEDTAVHILPVLLPIGTDREFVMEAMKREGIQTSIHYPCVHRFSAYRASGQSLPKTEMLSDRLLTLPFFPDLTERQCRKVVDTLMHAIDRR